MTKIVVLGESLVDVVDSIAHPGGSPLNVAVGLSRLGQQVRFYTEFGRDDYGRAIAEHLAESGVELADGSVSDRSTSVALVKMDEHSNAHYTFDIHQQLPPVREAEAPELMHTGSIAVWVEPSGHSIVEAFGAAQPSTLRSYDPNLRPDLVTDRAATVRRIEVLVALSHVVKLSDVDAQWLYPELDQWQVLEHLAELGAKLCVMTRGADGCRALADGQRYEATALPTTLQDTIGAGDAFMSGLLHGVLSGELAQALRAGSSPTAPEVRRALHHALASAALTVAQRGANPPWAKTFAAALSD
ncbi:carbohydrate kinase family protein [Glutamicibacter endophyticus]|uniref:carbohydrate kinase family protein n=1 Tax=Glutamicibacter endophyticus TaxID=1522174 RepID=UPI003AEF1E36